MKGEREGERERERGGARGDQAHTVAEVKGGGVQSARGGGVVEVDAEHLGEASDPFRSLPATKMVD